MGVTRRFKSKRCLVGGTGLIADAIAARLEVEGGTVSRLQQPVKSLATLAGARAAVAEIIAETGGLDVVVTAFDFRNDQPFLEIDDAIWSQTIDANLTTTFFVASEAARTMIRDSGGTIVLVGSEVGARPGPRTGAYAAAKAGVHLLATGMALDLAPDGVRVCAVAASEGAADQGPGGDFGADDVAGAVAFCASDEGSYVLGSTFFPTGPLPLRG
jgi:3-oxoacyl-[acyl-carrier protein] reductase